MDLSFERRTAGDRPRVLVIEPNRNYLGVLAKRLTDFGYRVASAETAQTAIAELYRIPVDLMLCEVALSGTSGIELVRMIRDDPVHREIPVLLFVGRSDPSSAVDAFWAGADGVVRKPCHFDILGACIDRQIKRSESLKRLAHDNAALDAKVISRVIELRDVRDQLGIAQREKRRLAAIVEGKAA